MIYSENIFTIDKNRQTIYYIKMRHRISAHQDQR